MLDHVPARGREPRRGELAFGTIDSFLLWRLTGGRVHATDATNASRTHAVQHPQPATGTTSCCACSACRARCCPRCSDCAADFGMTEPALFGAAVPIGGMAGDQQAASFGQACFQPGMAKSTYGTGCFVLLNTGARRVASQNRLLTTIAYRLDGETAYALEGSIFVAGAAIQWLRDRLGIISRAENRRCWRSRPTGTGVYLVPAFTGLGAPYWDAERARRDLRPDPQCGPRRAGARRARGRRLSDAAI